MRSFVVLPRPVSHEKQVERLLPHRFEAHRQYDAQADPFEVAFGCEEPSFQEGVEAAADPEVGGAPPMLFYAIKDLLGCSGRIRQAPDTRR